MQISQNGILLGRYNRHNANGPSRTSLDIQTEVEIGGQGEIFVELAAVGKADHQVMGIPSTVASVKIAMRAVKRIDRFNEKLKKIFDAKSALTSKTSTGAWEKPVMSVANLVAKVSWRNHSSPH
jgi:hypothetical protein